MRRDTPQNARDSPSSAQAFGGRHAYVRRLEPLSPGGWIFGGGSRSSELNDNSRVSGRSLGRLVGHIRGGRGLRRTDDVEGHESRNKVHSYVQAPPNGRQPHLRRRPAEKHARDL